MRAFSINIVLVSLLAASGCADNGRVKVYPVHGKVLVNGQPAEGARIVFYSADPQLPDTKTPTPAGTTDANGEFRLESFESGDGAPAGEFNVTVVWPEPLPDDGTGIFAARDRLRGRYADPEKSGLTATVEPGGVEIPAFELQ